MSNFPGTGPTGPVEGEPPEVVRKLIERDPFILYLDETDSFYQVRNGEQLQLTIPKDRAVPQAYPARRPKPLQQAYHWLGLAFLGLPLAGLGAIIFAPLAAAAAFRLYLQAASNANRIYSMTVILLAGGLWLVGLLLAVILLVHIL